MSWREKYKSKIKGAEEALKIIKNGDRVFIGGGAAQPQTLVKALVNRGKYLMDTEIVHTLTLGVSPYTSPKFADIFRHNAFFISEDAREAVKEGRADYTPIFLSEVPKIIKSGLMPIDVALIQVSPPDDHGFCTLGVSVDIVKSAAETADTVIAEVNKQMPRTLGDSLIHIDDIDTIVESDLPLPEWPSNKEDEVANRIGEYVAALIENGATIQTGYGNIPDAVLQSLHDKKDLGVHTEMFSDGVVDLVNEGVITCEKKTIHRGKIIGSFCIGSKKLYKFVDNNPMVEFHPSDYTNDPFIISRNDRMVAINSALQVDLTGQVCADSMGHVFYSGIGGHCDFMRGAARSKGGKPIVVMPSTAMNGEVSRIVPFLSQGAGVVETRGDIHYVVTEYGIAYLYGRSIRERVLELINIAHPKFRTELLKKAKELNYIYKDQLEISLKSDVIYPKQWETQAIMKDGTLVFFRPIKPTDEPLMKEFFYSLSEESIYLRFFTVVKAMPHKRLQYFSNVDYRWTMAIVGLVKERGVEKLIAVGRYGASRGSDMAEVAFLVHDDYQGIGIGKFLLNYLIKIAKANNIKGFTAEVLPENRRMLDIFYKSGYEIKSRLEEGSYYISFEFDSMNKKT